MIYVFSVKPKNCNGNRIGALLKKFLTKVHQK